MENKNSNTPAFVVPIENLGQTNQLELKECNGLTKREYFAGLAMQGAMNEFNLSESHDYEIAARIAKRATRVADELLKELEKNG